MERNTLFEIPHIRLIESDSGLYCLVVEDTELNDYVEDFLWDEFEYQSTSVSRHDRKTPAIYCNYFDANFSKERLLELLNQLDPGEVARIYKLNN
ncbi:hypothetical protein QWZ08_11205 [Ferruginibacter paludis]|uniref:hypothetical protein n=1 Tax=Ferruginibacter paludis TaxID=1310417 RepID=UPI0025B42B89|nr:hypothetical protein [Ferruginibacter paludis]MDN3656198.1 hypothetical protein [Ferruginibacter paludis]